MKNKNIALIGASSEIASCFINTSNQNGHNLFCITSNNSFNENCYKKLIVEDYLLDENKICRYQDNDKSPFVYCGAQIISKNAFVNFEENIFSINKIWNRSISNDRLMGYKNSNEIDEGILKCEKCQLEFPIIDKIPIMFIDFKKYVSEHRILSGKLYRLSSSNEMKKFLKSSLNNLKKMLFGKHISYEFEAHQYNRKGKVEAEIVGGNLSILFSLLGSNSQLNTTGKILFIEDLDEYHYHLDRMLLALRRRGAFNNLRAVVLGEFSDIHDHDILWGLDVRHSLRKHFEAEGVPVYEHPIIGHGKENWPIILQAV